MDRKYTIYRSKDDFAVYTGFNKDFSEVPGHVVIAVHPLGESVAFALDSVDAVVNLERMLSEQKSYNGFKVISIYSRTPIGKAAEVNKRLRTVKEIIGENQPDPTTRTLESANQPH